MIHRIYEDGSYSDGDAITGALVHEIDIPEGAEIPEPWASARRRARELPEEKTVRLQAASIDDLAVELLAGHDRDAVIAAIKAHVVGVDPVESKVEPRAKRTASNAMIAEDAPMNEESKPVERRESSLARAWRRGVWEQPWPVKAFALAVIALVSIGSLLWIGALVGVVDDGTEGPSWVGSVATDGVICPSMAAVQHEPERWAAGSLDLKVQAGWLLENPNAVVGPCNGPPKGGVTQIRLRGDLVEGYPDDPTRTAAAVTFRAGGTGPVLSAVVYAEPAVSWCTVRHELGHAQLGLGLPTPERPEGHATAATSIMYGSTHGEGAETACGDSWDLLIRSLYPEAPDASP